MLAAAALCSWVLRASTGAVGAGYDLDLNTEGRYRAVAMPGAPAQGAAELEVFPRATLTVAEHLQDLALSYYPRLTLADRPGEHLALLSQASVVSGWRTSPQWKLTGTAEGAYGTIGLLQLMTQAPAASPSAPPPTTPPEAVESTPEVSALKYVNGQLSLALAGSPAPRFRARATVGGFIEGGASSSARLSLPLQRGGRMVAGLDWDVAHREVVGAELSALYSDVSLGAKVWTARLIGSWRRYVSPETQVWLGLGAAFATHQEGGATSAGALPSGEAGLNHDGRLLGYRLQALAAIQASPVVDRITAAIYERASGSTSLTLELPRSWALGVLASGGRVMNGPQEGDVTWAGEARVSRLFGESVRLSLGSRGLSQTSRTSNRFYEWSLFFAAELRDKGHL
jgi:hypothetical protein